VTVDDSVETGVEVEEVDAELVASLTVVAARDCQTEAYLYSDDTIGLYVRNGGECVTASYWLHQARALHEALGHLLWLADHPAPAQVEDES